MNKLNIGLIVSALTLLGMISGVVLRFGPLPAALAKQEERLDKVEVSLSTAEKNYIAQAVELEYLKKNSDMILRELRDLKIGSREPSPSVRRDSR